MSTLTSIGQAMTVHRCPCRRKENSRRSTFLGLRSERLLQRVQLLADVCSARVAGRKVRFADGNGTKVLRLGIVGHAALLKRGCEVIIPADTSTSQSGEPLSTIPSVSTRNTGVQGHVTRPQAWRRAATARASRRKGPPSAQSRVGTAHRPPGT